MEYIENQINKIVKKVETDIEKLETALGKENGIIVSENKFTESTKEWPDSSYKSKSLFKSRNVITIAQATITDLNEAIEKNKTCLHRLKQVPEKNHENNDENTKPTTKGVKQTKSGKWTARIKTDGKTIHLGTFKTEDEAVTAFEQKQSENKK